ncbi:MAG: hypothetical protein H6900_14895 [Rhodobacter sp.]|uniref:hypothetical protein n=1 Tax=Pararhodobacter sp. TaxID=2127056 RepID=UPI001DC36DE6|nr:hypothetical protein [Pararhodobacter sp.]MCB1344407.1 hypothetical protein [Paracoccaceae bacterium]MCC0074568.1 hypothetical protein [Rhodobacter sp.]HPD92515.1 hypothetical protein [Pararhodobacter sp.]
MRGNPTRLVSWGLPLLTAAVYAVLVLHFGRQLIAEAQGQLPFDLRAWGYSLNATRDYLRALSPAGYQLAAGPILWTDTLFPALLGLTLAWWMRPYRGAFGMVCVLAAMVYVALDWGENWAVQRILFAGPDWLNPADAARASAFTQGKFAALALALVLAARQGWRRHRG